MKTNIFCALLCATIVSCNHKSEVSPARVEALNIITLQYNNRTYTDSMEWMKWSKEVKAVYDTTTSTYVDSFNEMKCRIRKTKDLSLFTLNLNNPKAEFPFRLSIINAQGPASGIGTYRAMGTTNTQTASNNINAYFKDISTCTFVETTGGNKTYNVDSALVNITNANGDTVIGSYQLWLSGTENKTIKGTINWNRAD